MFNGQRTSQRVTSVTGAVVKKKTIPKPDYVEAFYDIGRTPSAVDDGPQM